MESLLFIVGTLAVWRASYMLQNDVGPYGIFARLQAWFWSEPHKVGGVKDMFRCFYCLSIWVALPVAVILAWNNFWYLPIYWLALSGGAVFINLLHEKNSDS